MLKPFYSVQYGKGCGCKMSSVHSIRAITFPILKIVEHDFSFSFNKNRNLNFQLYCVFLRILIHEILIWFSDSSVSLDNKILKNI
jgi:hypothetical protein